MVDFWLCTAFLVASLLPCKRSKHLFMNPFIVTDQSTTNMYGFRVMTDGIDMTQFKRNPVMLFMHNRNAYKPTGDEVIGKWEAIKKKDGQILMTPKFDEQEEFAKKIKGKVERDFINMCSIGFRIIETSEDPKLMLPGQTRPTVTKCKLVEVSIVDIGANDNSMKLYAADGQMIALNDALPLLETPKTKNPKTEYSMEQLKLVATSLELKGDADLSQILKAIGDLKQDALDAQTKLAAFKKEVEDAQKEEATSLMAKLTDAKLVDKEGLETYKALFAADHDSTKKVVETMLKAVNPEKGSTDKLSQYLNGLGDDVFGVKKENLSFDWLSKNAPEKLTLIEEKDPKLFARLLAEY